MRRRLAFRRTKQRESSISFDTVGNLVGRAKAFWPNERVSGSGLDWRTLNEIEREEACRYKSRTGSALKYRRDEMMFFQVLRNRWYFSFKKTRHDKKCQKV